jgi:hypothetical protein
VHESTSHETWEGRGRREWSAAGAEPREGRAGRFAHVGETGGGVRGDSEPDQTSVESARPVPDREDAGPTSLRVVLISAGIARVPWSAAI